MSSPVSWSETNTENEVNVRCWAITLTSPWSFFNGGASDSSLLLHFRCLAGCAALRPWELLYISISSGVSGLSAALAGVSLSVGLYGILLFVGIALNTGAGLKRCYIRSGRSAHTGAERVMVEERMK
jgi:hypothetical protein